uniref:Uncharacterized protein n=1 Tax=Candidatus Kentrum sp. DK TaxID=2126562 RepID=A0A450S3E8_9GAMM|nr:MAG: hypothetical protein BECKDK2373C_GA0170839_101421 [Candidatus Kentron sp. DK]
MWRYKTLYGQQINLDELTVSEQRIYLHFLHLAGGPSILNEDCTATSLNTSDTDSPGQLPIDPLAFDAAYSAMTSRMFEGNGNAAIRAEQGLLRTIVDDLTLRLRCRSGQSTTDKWADALYDPARLLHELAPNYRTLREFREKTGLTDKTDSQVSRYLGGKSNIPLPDLKNVAKKLKRPVVWNRLDLEPTPDAITCRDHRNQDLGQRLQSLVAFSPCLSGTVDEENTRKSIERIFRHEYLARSGGDEQAWRAALRRAENNRARFGLEGNARLIIFAFDRDKHTVPDLLWLFLAIELHWFEDNGLQVFLMEKKENLPTQYDGIKGGKWISVKPAGEIQVPNEKSGSSNADISPSWRDLYSDLVRQPLYGPYDDETGSLPPNNDKQKGIGEIEKLSHRLYGLAVALESDSHFKPFVEEVVGRWRRSLKPKEPEISESRRVDNPVSPVSFEIYWLRRLPISSTDARKIGDSKNHSGHEPEETRFSSSHKPNESAHPRITGESSSTLKLHVVPFSPLAA